ncbi:MAG: primosomal protein N', partial [Prevotella sp.]|nr:primosomal protein N' [Prevotella sp.]
MTYCDVILPLPLDGLFTYFVPTEWESAVQPFVRAIVPFGITKTHTALIVRVHEEPPQKGITIKPIQSVIDKEPVLLPSQYKLWQWISNYYMCPLGDILSAALPLGMKKEEAYRPRLETYIRIGADYTSQQSLHNALNILRRSPKQLEVFTTYLSLSGLDSGAITREITKEELINASHSSYPIVKALVDKGMLSLYDKEVGRLNTSGEPHPERIKPLSEVQKNAMKSLISASGVSLLHGV